VNKLMIYVYLEYDFNTQTIMSQAATIISSHSGELNQKQLNKILFEIKEALINLELDRAVVKKTYNIAVESIENCLKHAADSKIEFTLAIVGDKTIIETKNIIANNEVDKLKRLLEEVNSLNQEDLLELYVEKLRHSVISHKGGAGLGIVDMAIKSGNSLSFDFQDSDEIYAIFKLKIIIN